MKIFLKYIIKSMLEKKSRFLLLLIAISISTGFLVTSIGVVDIAISSFTKPMLELYENKELQITSKGNDNFFETDNINENGVKNIQKEIYIGGFYNVDDEIKDLGIRGREENLLKSDKIIAGSISDFKGNKCIISKRVSEDLDLEVNDTIKVIIGGQPKELEIAAINSNDTIFYNDTASNFTIIVPYEYLAKDFNAEGKYNSIFADSDEENVQKAIDKFNENNSDFECSKLFDEESIKAQTGNFINTLYLMLVIVVFMSAIIIYGSFKLTITERMPIIGTFLSQGATSKTIEVILYCESILYGIIGAIIGNIIAVFGLKGISRIISPLKEYGIYENPNISLKYFIIGTIFSVFLSLVSSIIPIRRIRKLQVKEVILNNVNTTMSISFKRFIVGVILIVISVVVNFISSELANNISIVFVLISITGLTLAYPKIIDIVTNVLCKFFKGRCNTVFLALNNLRTSKVLLSNITLIIISLLSVLLITSIGTSIKVTLVDCYEKLNYDISIFNISTIREDEVSVEDKIKQILRSNENINFNSVQGITFVTALIDGKTVYLQGIEADKYKNYN